jgi:tetratricopeptide (TPR) repeat protein
MKILNYEILAPRKIIFIFLLAIFLPSLIVGYLSFSTFSQRREAVNKLLESNLWISGEAALKSIEEELLDHERKALESENFTRLIHTHKDNNTSISSSLLQKDIAGQLFVLDADFKILYPKTDNENALIFQWEKDLPDSQFVQTFQKAEFFEFSQKEYTRAVELYNQCTLQAHQKRYQAIALEGLGRCLLSLKKYDEAYKVYNDLSQNYGQFKNKAGHPYGIIAALQLYKIDQLLKREPNNPKILLDLYKKIQEGVWPIDIST